MTRFDEVMNLWDGDVKVDLFSRCISRSKVPRNVKNQSSQPVVLAFLDFSTSGQNRVH